MDLLRGKVLKKEHVSSDSIEGKLSTVLLSRFEDEEETFETMFFPDGEEYGDMCRRSSTAEDAMKGHESMKAIISLGLSEDETYERLYNV